MSEPVAKDLDEAKELREVIDALRADNGRLLRLLIAGFVSDARPEHKTSSPLTVWREKWVLNHA